MTWLLLALAVRLVLFAAGSYAACAPWDRPAPSAAPDSFLPTLARSALS